MACIKQISSKLSRLHKNTLHYSFLQQCKAMSQFPKYYIQPVFKKDAQEEIVKSGEAAKMAHLPIRPALIDQTSSKFYDDDVRLFTNYIMRDGNKILARSLLDKAFECIKRMQIEKYHKAKTEESKSKIIIDPKKIFLLAVDNCKPVLNLTPIKRGGVRYQVPIPISEKRSQFLSMKWLIEAAKDKERRHHFPEQLAKELVEAANNTGRVVKRKQDLHKQCEANRAYAHYRWS